MPSINGGSQFDDDYVPQEWNDPKPVKEVAVYAPDPDEKFDFQNMDVKLYLALRDLVKQGEQSNEDEIYTHYPTEMLEAGNRAMYEFTQSFGPIPDWAVARNFSYGLVPGAQLCTRDGRRTGNAHIVHITFQSVPAMADRKNPYGDVQVFNCLTDAGSKFAFTEVELLEAFTIGDWISDPARVIKDFDRNGEFKLEPN